MNDEDEVVISDDGASAYEIKALLAYQGKQGCRSLVCRRMYSPGSDDLGECMGWHCGVCGDPSSQYGHRECHAETA